VLIGLFDWGSKYALPGGAPLRLSHQECGAEVHAEVRCPQGHQVPLNEVAVTAVRKSRDKEVPA
jgi:hypothetical protein